MLESAMKMIVQDAVGRHLPAKDYAKLMRADATELKLLISLAHSTIQRL
jgi:hypothetical protein